MTMQADDNDLIERARAAGLLGADAAWPAPPDAQVSRPWPVVLLTALGAWLAAIPLTGVLVLMLSPALRSGSGAVVVGALVLAGSVAVLRQRALPLFVEQLAVPGLLSGAGCLVWGLVEPLRHHESLLFLLLLVVCVGVAAAVPRPWLRVLLGASAAGLAMGLLQTVVAPSVGLWGQRGWIDLHLLLALWVATGWMQGGLLDGARAHGAALLEDLRCGWLLACLFALCSMAGQSFLVAGLAPALGGMMMKTTGMGIGSALLAVAAAGQAAYGWPGLRRWPLGVAAVLLAALAWLMPSLGGVLLALALLLGSARWRQAGAAAVAAAWVLGAFYYSLQWPLAEKALWLAGIGALFLLLGGALGRARMPVARAAVTDKPSYNRAGWVFVALVLVAVNGLIWQKEALIRDGAPVYVPLAPVDPRSLMQGDYMRLNFSLRPKTPGLAPGDIRLAGGERPRLIVGLDERRVATPLRVAQPGEAPGPNELLLELAPKAGDWILVTDAWFFREGQGAVFARARFGEFRVLPDGRALLVGLSDEALKPLSPEVN